ncbi:MAG: B12-binding domain-containing radical SAM protein [Ruminococcaceae bacterium]|nr:B12-binding domain-containing radical SAM protein [Oscillospiraceae bacterium]
MRVLLINPSVGYYTRALSNPLGLLSIATYLKRNGHEVRIYDRCVDKTALSRVMKEFNPQIAGVSVMSSRGLKDAVKISKTIKKAEIPVIWGGQLPSMQAELVLENDFVDFVSFGEGEITWKELSDVLTAGGSIDDIDGIAYKKNGKIIFNKCRPFSDLADMPVSDWSLLDVPKYMQNYLGCKKMMYIYSSKGCPCRCAFCSNVNFHKSTHRKRPNEYVIAEIKYLIQNHGLDGVFFSDELWCIKRSDMLDFCRRVKEEKLDFSWGVQLRVGIFGEEDFKIMYDAGCRWVFFGVETGSPEMLDEIHKEINLNKLKPSVDAMKKIGITSICSYIVGFPDETEKQLKETVKLINETDANLMPVYHFTPLPGTELYNKMVKANRYKEPNSLKELSKVVATESVGKNLSAVPSRDLRVIRSWYHWKGFTNKTAYSSGKSFEFAKQTIISGLHSISLKGPVSFLVNGFAALYEFLYVFWYSHAYPSIIEKYELRK